MRADPARRGLRPPGALPESGLGRGPPVRDPRDNLGRPEVVRYAPLLLEALLADPLEGLAHVGRGGVPVLELRVQNALEAHTPPKRLPCAALSVLRVVWTS